MSPRDPSRRRLRRGITILLIPFLCWLLLSPFVLLLGNLLAQAIHFHAPHVTLVAGDLLVPFQAYLFYAPHFILVALTLLLALMRRARATPLIAAAIVGSLSAHAFQLWFLASGTAYAIAFSGNAFNGPKLAVSLGYLAFAAPLILFATALTLLIASRIIRPRYLGHCPSCSYDLRNLPPHAPCPECGALVPPAP